MEILAIIGIMVAGGIIIGLFSIVGNAFSQSKQFEGQIKSQVSSLSTDQKEALLRGMSEQHKMLESYKADMKGAKKRGEPQISFEEWKLLKSMAEMRKLMEK